MKMRRFAIYPLLLVLAALILSACAPRQPRIEVETDSVDFGEMINGEIATREVRVRNAGDAPLVVEAVSTSCGCTTATLEPMTIQPGETALLRIEFDSGAHGPEANGPLTRQVFIASNDPEQTETVVEIKANVLPPAP